MCRVKNTICTKYIQYSEDLYFQATATGAIVNGVPVIDVLEQAADSSNESSASADNQGDAHETDPIGNESPQFITVTGKWEAPATFCQKAA